MLIGLLRVLVTGLRRKTRSQKVLPTGYVCMCVYISACLSLCMYVFDRGIVARSFEVSCEMKPQK